MVARHHREAGIVQALTEPVGEAIAPLPIIFHQLTVFGPEAVENCRLVAPHIGLGMAGPVFCVELPASCLQQRVELQCRCLPRPPVRQPVGLPGGAQPEFDTPVLDEIGIGLVECRIALDIHDLMRKLRERKKHLLGRCAACKWLDICNGNFRVRAEAVSGDVWAEEPDCYLTDEEIGL